MKGKVINMQKKDYKSSISLQIESLPELFRIQSEHCFSEKVLTDIMKNEEYAKIKKLIITGCGDSFTAGGVAASILNNRIGNVECEAYDPMEYTRFLKREDLVEDDTPENTLVLVISSSGGAARISEMLLKSNEAGVKSMLISNSKTSKGAQVAQMLYYLDTPPLSNTPGLRSYVASLIGIISIGCMIGVANGSLPQDGLDVWKKMILEYADMLSEETFEKVDNQMFELADQWKHLRKYEFIGDGSDFYTAQFLEEKFIESDGLQSDHANSEDWCHINYFLKNANEYGTVVIANKNTPSYSRVIETVKSAAGIGRRVLVITNGAKEDFDERAIVCVLPSPDINIDELYSLISYIPAAYIAEYIATLSGRDFFGSFDTKEQKFMEDRMKGIFDHMSTGKSEIKIVL